jgi:hypothetical protein
MTNHDIQLVALGIAAGMDLMLLVQMVFAILDDRRDRKVLRAAEAKLAEAKERAAEGSICSTCGRHNSDPEEADAYYCHDCGRYINPAPGSPLKAEADHIAATADDVRADWQRSHFRLIGKAGR